MRMIRYMLVCVLFLAGVVGVHAQVAPQPVVEIGASVADVEEVEEPVPAGGIEITADRFEYQGDRNLMIGVGNVRVAQDGEILKADCVTVNRVTQDAYATGNVTFERGGSVWEGEELTYNFATGEGDFGEFSAYMEPFYLTAADSERVAGDRMALESARVTTCKGDHPAFFARARNIEIFGETKIRARNVVFFLGPIPIMYIPFCTFDTERRTNLDVLPGYGSDWGAYMLMAYNYHFTKYVSAATHVDYYGERGWGFGQDVKWDNTRTAHGKIKTYFIDDERLYKDLDEQNDRPELEDSGRYRIRFEHAQTFGERDYLLANVGYLSDPYVLEDFFRDEYRDTGEPETHVSIAHRGDDFTASVLIDKRLNDFYTHINRIPEVNLDFQCQPVGNSSLYYAGQNQGVYLEKEFAKLSGEEDYDVTRLDSHHEFYYPARHFGFLNTIPRAGYRATYYSKTIKREMRDEMISETNTTVVGGVTNSVITTTNVSREVSLEGGADIRNLFELGMEASFKAFKVLAEPYADGNGGLRHVIEPYADYTYVPEPNLKPDDIYYFDSIDGLDKTHNIKLGMRNKLQTKHRRTYFQVDTQQTNVLGEVWDLLDLDLYTYYRIEKEPEENDFSDLYLDAEVRPAPWMRLDFDGRYDMYESEARTFNAQLAFLAPDDSSLAFDYRYRKDISEGVVERSLGSVEINLFPSCKWSLGSYWRYEIEDGHLEEQSYFIERTFECLGLGVGYTGRGDDYTWWVNLWLLAFPEAVMGGDRY